MQKTSVSHDSWSWFYYALSLGCLAGWFWVSAWRLETFLSGQWLFTYLLPAAIAACFLPALGAMGDLWGTRARMATYGAALLWLLMLLGGLTGLSEALLAPIGVFALLVGNTLHQSLVCGRELQDESYFPARGFAATLLLMLLAWFCRDVLDLALPWLPVLLIPSAIFLVLFALRNWEFEREKVPFPVIEAGRAMRRFPTEVPSFADVRDLLLFLFLFAAASAQLEFTVWSGLAEGTFPIPARFFPLIFFSLMMVGAFATASITHAYGPKRTLVLSSLISALLLVGLHFSQVSWEIALMIMLMATVLGITQGVVYTMAARIIPPKVSGQASGYLVAALVLGIAAGKLLQLANRPGALPLLNLALYIGALVLAVRLSPGRAIRQMEGITAEELKENPRDVEWRWFDGQLQGLAHPTAYSLFTRFLARTITEIFFGRLRIIGRENLQAQHGAILVANHPNTFFDPLLVTALAPGRLHYWAKSTLWHLPILGSILDRLGAIPVYRRQDHGEGGQSGNKRTMEVAATKINDGAHMLIFPEGVSQVGLSLKPIKTGAARLGFHALTERDWREPLPLIPIALDYSEPSLFRGGVTMRIGEPLQLDTYRESYEEEPRRAVTQVTGELTNRLKNMLPHLEEPQLEELVVNIQELYGERVLQILGEKDETTARKTIADAVNHYQTMDPDTVYLFNMRMQAYQQERERLSTPDNHEPIPIKDLFKILMTLFSLPSFGLVTNWLPYRFTGRLVDAMATAPVWTATAKLGIGGLLFGVWYLLIWLFCYTLVGGIGATLAVFCIAFSAFVALGAMDRYAFRFRQLKTVWEAFWTQDTNEDLEAMKLSLIQDLERFRETYEFYKAREMDEW